VAPPIAPAAAATAARALSAAYREALLAHERGWSVIPCTADKKPDWALLRAATGRAEWKQYQDKRASLETLETWQGADAFAVVTGWRSGVAVLDVDPGGMESIGSRPLPETPCVKTPRGWHYYYRHPGGRVPQHNGFLPGLDFKGDGAYVVLPGSTGRWWATGMSPEEVPLADMPEWLLLELVGESPRPRRNTKPAPLRLDAATTAPAHLDRIFHLAGSLTGEIIKGYFSDEECVPKIMRYLGVPPDSRLDSFCDILPNEKPDRNPSAGLYRNGPGEEFIYHSWRTSERIVLSAVHASLRYGTIKRLRIKDSAGQYHLRPEATVWAIQLLVENGLAKKVAVPHKPLPHDLPWHAPSGVSTVYDGFISLLGCKWLYEHEAATPFTRDFAHAWCGVGDRQAGLAVHWLEQNGYIVATGKWKGVKLFLPRMP